MQTEKERQQDFETIKQLTVDKLERKKNSIINSLNMIIYDVRTLTFNDLPSEANINEFLEATINRDRKEYSITP